MIEDDLRAAFTRHEPLAPPTGPLRAAIDRIAAARRSRRRRRRVGAAALALLAVTGLGAVRLAVPEDRPARGDLLLGQATGHPPAGAVNLLLLGVDSASGARPPLADSVLLLHLPADRSRLYLLSLPRDVRVPVPGHGTDKLNAAFAFGSGSDGRADLAEGYRLTEQAVRQLTGLRIDAGAVLTYPVLRDLTDALDGVRLCLPDEVRSSHTRRVFPAGCQHLDGDGAVDLLRQRRSLPDGTLDRDRNAQRFAAALLRRVDERGALTDPVRLSRLLAEVAPDVTVSLAGGSLFDLLPLAAKLRSIEAVGLSLPTVPVDAPSSQLAPDPAAAPALLAALREDRLAEWVTAHPEHVTVSGQR
ncbi:LCP family protein [Micromonospora sp. B11E3]|uniref:LCP family protein n=1 Tax=Micromonospora sp. B11E3 TaxID=3153562 RepID=UPI00325E1077